ncbi:hypothetical protein BQ8420_06990 [Nocardiopsis sp. JB363]|nr:hypothetical protein BQ8420_06990 [Nocardiopsis sp. JB363]
MFGGGWIRCVHVISLTCSCYGTSRILRQISCIFVQQHPQSSLQARTNHHAIG